MRQFLLFAVFVLTFWGCGESSSTKDTSSENEIEFIRFQDYPPKLKLNSEAQKLVSGWDAFVDFERSYDLMYRSNNYEELLLAVEDLVQKEQALRESEFPKLFEEFQVFSRIKVVKTFLLKTKASIQDKTSTDIPLKQMIVAYNALRNQLNIVVINQLDLNLILQNDEETINLPISD